MNKRQELRKRIGRLEREMGETEPVAYSAFCAKHGLDLDSRDAVRAYWFAHRVTWAEGALARSEPDKPCRPALKEGFRAMGRVYGLTPATPRR